MRCLSAVAMMYAGSVMVGVGVACLLVSYVGDWGIATVWIVFFGVEVCDEYGLLSMIVMLSVILVL